MAYDGNNSASQGTDAMQRGIRKRVTVSTDDAGTTTAPTASKINRSSREVQKSSGDHAFLLLLPLTAVLVLFGVVGTLRMRQHAVQSSNPTRVFTVEELSRYNGKRGGPLYLSILGSVFDVTQGKRHYGPGGSYHFFAGRDASRAYTTGKFDVDLHDDIRDLSPERMSELVGWRQFYHNNAKYPYVGRVIGRFYNAKGNPLPLLAIVESQAAEYTKEQDQKKAQKGRRCGYRWHKDTGSQVYCDEKEGTVPRRVHSESEGDTCMCLSLTESFAANGTVYEGCASDSSVCVTKRPKDREHANE